MWCKIYFIESDNDDYETTLSSINKNSNYNLITNNLGLIKSAKLRNIPSYLLENLQPDINEKAIKNVYETNELLQKYRIAFKFLTYDEKEIFNGFDYTLFRQLLFLIKIKNILEERKNFIFIFEGITIPRIQILKIALKLGYTVDEKIGIIENNNTKFISSDEKIIMDFLEKKSLKNTTNLMNKSNDKISSNGTLFKRYKFLKKISPIIKKWLIFKINLFLGRDPIKVIKNQLNKKFIDSSDVKIGIFLTTSRSDLYLNPWKTCFEKFEREKQNYKIFTSDFTTESILSNEPYPYISFFEEVNILSREIPNTKIGKKILGKFNEILLKEKELFGLELLKNDIKKRIIRTISIIIISQYLFNVKNFKAIIACSDGDMLEDISILLAKERKIKSYSMVPTYLDYQPMFANWFHSDKIFCYGLEDFETLKKLGYESKLIMVGNPKYDKIKSMKSAEKRDYMFSKYGIDKNKKLITILMSEWHENDEVWIPKLINFSNNNGYEIIIKTHPKYLRSSQDLHKSKIDKINSKCQDLQYLISHDIDVSMLIGSTDLIITDYSAIGLDAIVMDKMLINVDFDFKEREKFNLTRQFTDSKFSLFVNDYNNLERIIESFFNKKLDIKQIMLERKKAIKKYDYYNDGKVSDRMYEQIIKDKTLISGENR